MKRSMQGRVVWGNQVSSAQIVFDESSGLIEDVGDLKIPMGKIDYHFHDDCLIFAAMGDVHIHAREDVSAAHLYKEDFLSASQAALNGGVLHICDMPNNPCPPIDDPSYENKFFLTQKSLIPMALYAGIGPKTSPLKRAVPYKAYMGPSVGDLYFENLQQLDLALQRYQGQRVSFHCEDPIILQQFKERPTHEERRPVQAEVMATGQALMLIEKYGLQGKLCHYSSKEGLDLIRAARRRGVQVECEVTPQHLYFSQEEMLALNQQERVLMQMNPPLREKEDCEALLQALKNGELDYLATDHAPHSPEEKLKGTSGLTGLDTYGHFVTWLLVEKGVDPLIISKVCCENPGRFFNQFLPTFHSWGKGFGKIEKDYSASFTVLNLRKPIRITKENLKTKAKSSPFENCLFPGSVEQLFLKGRPVL